jgi:glycine betaine/proline transport system ATP-binding protein
MSSVEVKNLFKLFGDVSAAALNDVRKGMDKQTALKIHRVVTGVKDVSFKVNKGEILVIMGLSGSGKSTLLRCINRLIEPTAGSVIIDGEDITRINYEKLRKLRTTKFGMVFQRFALFPHKSVIDNVAYGLEVQKVHKDERYRKAIEALELVGLKGWENYYPENLSGGMQQRVGLARALAIDPDILLMDEAFSALDPLIKREMQEELLTLQSKVNKTIIFITHDLDEALKLGDRIVLMKDGEVVQIGEPEEILTCPADTYVEKFVENVDVSKVLTASSVMVKPFTVTYPKDGPKTALLLMKEEGISSVMVVNRERHFLGIVHVRDVRKAAELNHRTLGEIIDKEVVTVSLDENMGTLISASKFPIAVTDDKGVLKGAVVRGSLLSALSSEGGSNG